MSCAVCVCIVFDVRLHFALTVFVYVLWGSMLCTCASVATQNYQIVPTKYRATVLRRTQPHSGTASEKKSHIHTVRFIVGRMRVKKEWRKLVKCVMYAQSINIRLFMREN